MQAAQNFWLSHWTNETEDAQSSGGDLNNTLYMFVYFAFGMSSLLFQASEGVGG